MNTIYAVMRDKKNSGLNRNSNQDSCDASAMLYQLGYQANWELVSMRVHDNPVDTCINIHVIIMMQWIHGIRLFQLQTEIISV